MKRKVVVSLDKSLHVIAAPQLPAVAWLSSYKPAENLDLRVSSNFQIEIGWFFVQVGLPHV